MRLPRTQFIFIASLLLASAALSQDPPKPPSDTAPLTRADLENAMNRIEKNASLDANLKSRLIGTYDQALTEIQSAEDFGARAAASVNVRKTAADTEKDLKEKSAQTPPTLTASAYDTKESSQLAQDLAEAQRELDDARNALQKIKGESDTRAERRRQLPDLLSGARTQLDQVRAATAPADAGPEEVEANRVYNAARARALEAEIGSYNEELATYEIRGALRVLEEDLAEQHVKNAGDKANLLTELVSLRRQEEAERDAEAARQALMQAAEVSDSVRDRVESIARRNTELAELIADDTDGPSAKTNSVANEIEAVHKEFARIIDESRKVLKREAAVGLTSAVGRSLRANRADLPPRRQYVTRIRTLEQSIGAVQLKQIEIDEERRAVSPEKTGEFISNILHTHSAAGDVGRAQQKKLNDLLDELLQTQRETLDKLQQEYEAYFSALVTLAGDEKKLLAQRDDFEDYIDQRVLWISSGDPLSLKDLRDAADAFQWFTDWRNWRDVARAALADLRDNPLINSIALLLALAAVFARPRLIARIARLSAKSEKRTAANYLWTAETLLHTVLLAAFGPFLLLYAGWRLGAVLTDSDFKGVFATALTVVAAVWASVEIPRQIFRPRGLGEVHFEWTPAATAAARRALSWAIPAALPVLLVIAMIESQEFGAWRESAGRLAFFVLMLLWAVLGHQLTHKNAPGVMIYFPLSIPGQRARIQRTLYLLSAGAPLALAIAAGFGYFDTALRLAIRIHMTLVFIFAVSLGVGLAMRALLLARRRLALEQARKKSAELREAHRKAADAMDSASAAELPLPDFNLAEIDVQTTRLTRSAAILALSVGTWFIWVDFVPALRVLDQITIGQAAAPIKSATKVEEVTDQFGALSADRSAPGPRPAAGDSTAASAGVASPATAGNAILSGKSIVQNVEALTVADVLLAAVVILLTISSARNLPGLLEIALLQRLPLAPGERYAIKAVLGYVFVLVGAAFALGILGIQWARMQWLVAGLGIGIGFGLQEIFANFMSGLIILFEQPIRVGDTVTVGDISGTVTRVRIRATTITDWEKKELIVPNKEFVTGKVVNWTLSDSIVRTTISIGVDYNSDTRRVRDILARVAAENPRVLKDPPPQVVFTAFGDSTLDFELRVFVANTESLLPCRDEIHHAINDALREAGIEIAFKQQDIHIRSFPPSMTSKGDPVPENLQRQ
jgi:potassium efflux system protein